MGRALMTNPRLLILDEATEGLAPLIREEIWNCLSMLKAQGQSVLVIDKNVGTSHPHRRPALHHRARQGGVERHVGRADRRARSAASVSGDLMKLRHARAVANGVWSKPDRQPRANIRASWRSTGATASIRRAAASSMVSPAVSTTADGARIERLAADAGWCAIPASPSGRRPSAADRPGRAPAPCALPAWPSARW